MHTPKAVSDWVGFKQVLLVDTKIKSYMYYQITNIR